MKKEKKKKKKKKKLRTREVILREAEQEPQWFTWGDDDEPTWVIWLDQGVEVPHARMCGMKKTQK